jgi:hypothetical protein
MAQAKKEGATKRTFRFSDDLIARVAKIAQLESRTITAQIEVFLWDKVRQYEKAQPMEGIEPGNSQPEALAA